LTGVGLRRLICLRRYVCADVCPGWVGRPQCHPVYPRRYNADVLEEGVLLSWDDERFGGTLVKVRKAVAPVIEWLRTAESDDDSDSDDDEEEEEGGEAAAAD
jgi:hypothetical protein